MARIINIISIFLLIFNFGFTPDRSIENNVYAFTIDSTKVFTHFFEDNIDSLSGPEIYELTDSNGISILFSRYIFREICMSGECRMVKLWIYWDGVGNFLGLKIPHGEDLTKSNHIQFTPADYVKLHGILKDTASILKNLSQEELVDHPDSIESTHIDAITSATRPTLSDNIVKDAVFTCHTLWHTVYGPVQEEIFRIINRKLNIEYLVLLLESNTPEYIFWGIDQLKKNPNYYYKFQAQILGLIKSDNSETAFKALTFLNDQIENDCISQDYLIDLLPEVEQNIRFQILWIFISKGYVSDNILLNLLQLIEEAKFDPGHLKLIYGIIRPSQLKDNDEIRQQVYNFLDHDNDYVRMISLQLLRDNNIKVVGQE